MKLYFKNKFNTKFILIFIIIITLIVVFSDSLLAAPGGKILSSKGSKMFLERVFYYLTKNPLFWFLAVLMIILLLPFIIYNYIIELYSITKSKKQLSKVSKLNQEFNWLKIKANLRKIFISVHEAWNNQDLEQTNNYISNWYKETQQTLYLDSWKKNEKQNITNIKNISKIVPIYFYQSNFHKFEGSYLVVKFRVNIEDYLIDVATNMIIDGEKGYKYMDVYWTFIFTQNGWKLDHIEDLDSSKDYLSIKKNTEAEENFELKNNSALTKFDFSGRLN